MINEINLLTLSSEAPQSDFPGLYNNNVNTTKLKINEIIQVIAEDSTNVSSISGALQDSVDELRTEVSAISGVLQTQIGTLPTQFSTVASTASISASLQSQIDSQFLASDLSSLTLPISTTSNITGSAFYGDGSNLTNLPPSGILENDLASLTLPISTTSNITGSAFYGDGSNLTGIVMPPALSAGPGLKITDSVVNFDYNEGHFSLNEESIDTDGPIVYNTLCSSPSISGISGAPTTSVHMEPTSYFELDGVVWKPGREVEFSFTINAPVSHNTRLYFSRFSYIDGAYGCTDDIWTPSLSEVRFNPSSGNILGYGGAAGGGVYSTGDTLKFVISKTGIIRVYVNDDLRTSTTQLPEADIYIAYQTVTGIIDVTNLNLKTLSTETLELADNGVVEGSYTFSDITVDSKGRIQSISNGDVTSVFEQQISALENRIAVNTLRDQINAGWSILNMIDGISDEYNDETGVDGATTTASYNSASDYYSSDNPDLQLLLKMDDTGLTDSSANNLTPTIGGAVARSATQSKFGGFSASFAGGATDNISYPHSSAIDMTTDYTIHFWVYYNDVSGIPGLWSKGAHPADNEVGMWLSGGNLDVLSGGAGVRISGTTTINTGQWYHVALVGDVTNGTTKLYLDGVQEGSTWVGNVSTNTDPLILGDYQVNEHIDGYIDDFVYESRVIWTTNFTPPSASQSTGSDPYVLQSEAFSADAQADNVRMVVLYEPVDASTINTDVKAYASRDGGTTWEEATLTDADDFNSTVKILTTGDIDVSSQTAGTSMKYKIETFSSKAQRIHGTWLQWR